MPKQIALNQVRRQILAGVGAFLVSRLSIADEYPSKPIKLIVPVPPGGGADFVARTYAAQISKTLNQPIVIDNRAGAAGIIAMEALAKSPSDGYTLIQTNISTVSINPFIYNKLPYDALKDYSPISLTSSDPLILVINSKLPVRNLKELIAFGKTKSGGLSYGSLGNGSIQHLAGYVFGQEASISALHVPYKGAAPVTVDLLAGQIDFAFSGPGTVASLIKSGNLIAIAQTTNLRSNFLPQIPTLYEDGFRKMEFLLWNGFLAPANTPIAIINKLSMATRSAAQSTELTKAFELQNINAISNTPEEFVNLIKKEQVRYASIVKESGIKADQ